MFYFDNWCRGSNDGCNPLSNVLQIEQKPIKNVMILI